MRQTDVESIMFPVAIRPVQYIGSDGTPRTIDTHRAVVNARDGQTLGVVGNGYRLVTNGEALDYAKACAGLLFKKAKPTDFEVFNVHAPRRPCFCQIDLLHKGYEVNIYRSEVYLPLIRVTNSYNGSRALRFDVGYCRKLCLNGVIFEKETIQFRYSHSQSSIHPVLDFKIRRGQMETLRKRFETNVSRLAGYPIPHGTATALFFKALELPTPPKNGKVSRTRVSCFMGLQAKAHELVGGYFRELGSNAYALFNAMTDFASNPPEILGFSRTPHSMQRTAGSWTETFASKIRKNGGLDLQEYLGEYAEVDTWSPAFPDEQLHMGL